MVWPESRAAVPGEGTGTGNAGGSRGEEAKGTGRMTGDGPASGQGPVMEEASFQSSGFTGNDGSPTRMFFRHLYLLEQMKRGSPNLGRQPAFAPQRNRAGACGTLGKHSAVLEGPRRRRPRICHLRVEGQRR